MKNGGFRPSPAPPQSSRQSTPQVSVIFFTRIPRQTPRQTCKDRAKRHAKGVPETVQTACQNCAKQLIFDMQMTCQPPWCIASRQGILPHDSIIVPYRQAMSTEKCHKINFLFRLTTSHKFDILPAIVMRPSFSWATL